MKRIIVILAFWWISTSAFSQSLPEDIIDFYQKYNFIETYTTDDELTEISFYLDQSGLPHSLQTERLSKVYEYYKDIQPQLNTQNKMPNAGNSNNRLATLGLLEIEDFKVEGNKIIVYCQSYSLDQEAQKYLIANFDGEEIMEIVSPKYQPLSKVTQTWTHESGVWQKADLNKILIHLN